MHLNTKQKQRLEDATTPHLCESASNYVFGSRINDLRYGVSYDFYIEAPQADPDEIVAGDSKVLADIHTAPSSMVKTST